jgi:hypothetical protein
MYSDSIGAAAGSNKSENQKEKTNSTLNSQPLSRRSTPKG